MEARNTIGRSGTTLNLNFFGLSGGDNVAKASDKFGTLNINHSVSKKWTLTGFAAYSLHLISRLRTLIVVFLNPIQQILQRSKIEK
jgi:hypothetical protein